jgi:hypothetical protein
MHAYKLEWHAHNVDLQAVEAYVKANFPHCVGNSADTALTFWFTEKLSAGQEQNLRSYWAALGSVSPEAQSYVPQFMIDEKIQELKADAVTKDWNQLSTTQKKLIANLPVTRQELGLA